MDGFTVLAEPTRRRILDELRFAQEPGDARSGRDVATLVCAWDCLSRPCQSIYGCFGTQESWQPEWTGHAGFTGFRHRRLAMLPHGWSRTDKCGS